jgi:uncharacterized membrane protein
MTTTAEPENSELVIMQDNDPHHLHSSGWEVYIYWIVAPLLVALTLYGVMKPMNYLDDRKKRRDAGSGGNEN